MSNTPARRRFTSVSRRPAKPARARKTQGQLADDAEDRLRKEKARLGLELAKARRDRVQCGRKMLSTHRAAEQNRFTSDWTAPSTSADSEILADLPRVTARCRQLIRDDAYAKSIQRSFIRNIIGTGITPIIDDKPYSKAFQAWARDKSRVDREGRLNLVRLTRWAVSELVAAGECFVVRWINQHPDRGPHLVCQRYESEQLDRYKYVEPTTKNEVRGGVEVDDSGRPVAYHFYQRHPHDVRGLARAAPLMMQSMRIPAHMVSHVYDPDRVLQSRGISRLAPVARKIRDLTEYDATQLRVARAEASIGFLISGTELDTDGNPVNPLEVDGLNVAYLTEDEKMEAFTPSRPGRDYDPFVKAQLRAIAAGVGISYEQIARDLTNTTFSGGRQGSIDDRREWQPLQALVVDQLLEPVFRDWLHVWMTANQAYADGYFTRPDPEEIQWMPQGWDWVDPESQGKAVELKMKLGLTTRTREASLLGTTVQSIDEEAARDGTAAVVDRITRAQAGTPPQAPGNGRREIQQIIEEQTGLFDHAPN